jgi:sulfate adenylyltransferase
MMYKPHGGTLIDRNLKGADKEKAAADAKAMVQIPVAKEMLTEMKNIGCGRFSPLEGFLTSEDLEGVLHNRRLASGTVWTIPIVLDVDKTTAAKCTKGNPVALTCEGKPVAILHVEGAYTCDKAGFARCTFGTEDAEHPGVARVQEMKDWLVGGKLDMLDDSKEPFPQWNLWPSETRRIFEEKGWKTIAGFQTRNAPHRGHELMQKIVMSMVDGMFINPVIGRKKKGDFRDEVIIKSYEALIANYYPADRVFMSILPMEMRYAGPREAIHHAIIRKNFGCTHQIVGRDHAGVGNYYHPEAAIGIFEEFDDLEIGPMTVRGDFFHCTKCDELASERTCPHAEEDKIHFSGTAIRKMIVEGQMPDPRLYRPEVFEIQQTFDKLFVE